MRTPKLSPLPEAVAALKARIEHWRMTRAHRCPMAQELWSEASWLAREQGIYGISRALRLNYEALKSRTEKSPPRGRGMGRRTKHARLPRTTAATLRGEGPVDGKPERKPAFIRLDPLTAISPSCSTVEVYSRNGTRMAIQLPATAAVDVVALVTVFVERR